MQTRRASAVARLGTCQGDHHAAASEKTSSGAPVRTGKGGSGGGRGRGRSRAGRGVSKRTKEAAPGRGHAGPNRPGRASRDERQEWRSCQVVSSHFGLTCRLCTIPSQRELAYVAHKLWDNDNDNDGSGPAPGRSSSLRPHTGQAVELSYYQHALSPMTSFPLKMELVMVVTFEGRATTAASVASRASSALMDHGHHNTSMSVGEHDVTVIPLPRAASARHARTVVEERTKTANPRHLPRIRCCRSRGAEGSAKEFAESSFLHERAFFDFFCPMTPADWGEGEGEDAGRHVTTVDATDATATSLMQPQQHEQQQQQQQAPSSALATIRRHPDPAARKKVESMLEESAGIPFKCPSLAKVQRWLDTVARLPLGVYSPPLEPTWEELERVRVDLDAVAHGMRNAKTAAVEMAAKLQLAPKAPMRALLLEGPPGCGKTTFATRALGRALRRPVRVINLGGVKDSTVLLGHNYTYEGSRPGRVVEELCAARVSDPVLVFDEVDKVSDTPGGREIVHVLMSLIDPVQNAEFVDSYLYGIPLDLSRALIVFTCNDISAIGAPLLDRLRVVTFAPPSAEEKRIATRDHVIPRVANCMGFLSLPPLLLPENVEDRDAIVDRLVDFCSSASSSSSDNTNGKGMRGIEKAVERVLMNASIRRIRLPSFLDAARCTVDNVDDAATLITRADVDNTLAIMRREQRDSEEARRSAAEGAAIDAYVRHSMYT